MNLELRQFVEQTRFCKASVQRVAELLPADDKELDVLIESVVQERIPKLFLHVIVAALSRERRVDARHLLQGLMLLGHAVWVGSVMLKVQGDVPEQVFGAMEQGQFPAPAEAGALLAIEEWCREHRQGKVPDKLILFTRRAARRDQISSDTRAYLLTLALRLKDAGIVSLLRTPFPKATDEQWADIEKSGNELGEMFISCCRQSILNLVGEKPESELARGKTMRRAVPRIGRNELCPCGSSKKYKHCCLEKDGERLHHSSNIAGVTREELETDPHLFLTTKRMDETLPHHLLKLDPLRIPKELLNVYFMRLIAFNLFERATEAFQALGCSGEMQEHWEKVMFMATRTNRKEIIQPLIDVRRKESEDGEVEVPLGAALMIESGNPAKVLQIIDESALEAVSSNDPDQLRHLAYGLLHSAHRALGICVARGVISTVPDCGTQVLEEILDARDALNLSPDDPIGDVVDKRFAESDSDDERLRAAQRSLEAKAEEVRGLKEKLEQLQRELVLRERRQAATIAIPTQRPDEAALKELRCKVEDLKSLLKERHTERNQLRRDLQKAQNDLERLQPGKAGISSDEETEAVRQEDNLLLPQDTPEVHPVRLIEFPKAFDRTLDSLPKPVARACMILAGRLAAGEPAAFVGALRLKAVPNVMRQRIGSDYRLLFRPWPDRLEIVDLINRKDLERRLKSLA